MSPSGIADSRLRTASDSAWSDSASRLRAAPPNQKANRPVSARPERRRGREPETERSGAASRREDDRDAVATAGDDEEQELLLRPRTRAALTSCSVRTLRSNLCQPLSPRRYRHVPFTRAQPMKGR